MQHEHNMKAHVYIESNINKHIKQLHYENKQVLCMDLLPLSSMLANLVTRFFTNRAKIPAIGLVEVSHPYMSSPYPFIASMSPLESLLLPSTLPYLY